MNNGQANGIMLLVDWLRGDNRGGHLVVTQERVVDALQALTTGAARQLQTGRRPDQVQTAAARLWDLVDGSDYEYAVACCDPNHPDYGKPLMTGDRERLLTFIDRDERLCLDLVRRPFGLWKRVP